MQASNISLTFVAAFAFNCAGGFVCGLAAGFSGNIVLGLILLLPAALGTAHFVGRWVARRDNAPSQAELKLGCLLYVVVWAFLGIGSGNGGVLIGFVISIGIVWTLYRAANIFCVQAVQTSQAAR